MPIIKKISNFVGIKDLPPIKESINTEQIELEVRHTYSDMVFLLNDGTGLIIEWEADISRDDLLRFALYNLSFSRQYKVSFKTIIFTNKRAISKSIISSTLEFKPVIINLGERNGDELLEKIKKQIENGEHINELELLYLPLYNKSTGTVGGMLKKVIALTKEIFSDEMRQNIMLLAALISNKFIPDEEFQEIWEEIHMLIDEIKILKYAKRDGVREGLERGRSEGLKRGHNQGLKRGRQEGQQENQQTVVRKSLQEKLPIEIISSISGMSIEDIQAIEKSESD